MQTQKNVFTFIFFDIMIEKGERVMPRIRKEPNRYQSKEEKLRIINWDVLSVFFKFSAEIRKIMYTTNAIESLNSTYIRINRNRNVFPTDMSLLKVLYLSTLKAEKKWSRMVDKWDLCLSQFRIMYEGRI